ncbi:hypothetical protein [Microbulbifer sp. ARAS458-1]|uniref:hypothetical protein n=1 Tax=Microbulbifer sp. ARAS458-1 TaxID=3140242 RepID=UPI003877952B
MNIHEAMQSIEAQAAAAAEGYEGNSATFVEVDPMEDGGGVTVTVSTSAGHYLFAEVEGVHIHSEEQAQRLVESALFWAARGFDLQGKRSHVAPVSYHSAPQCIQ